MSKFLKSLLSDLKIILFLITLIFPSYVQIASLSITIISEEHNYFRLLRQKNKIIFSLIQKFMKHK